MRINTRHIRFGVICENKKLLAWQKEVIEILISEADVELKLLIFENDRLGKKRTGKPVQSSSIKPGISWNLYYRYLVRKKSKALQEVEITSIFEGIPHINLTLLETDGFAQLQNTETKKLETVELDFILNFSTLPLIGKVLNAAKFGIWSYQFGDQEKYIGNTLSFWEIYKEDVLTKASLIRLTNAANTSILLKEGYLKTNISYPKNIDNIHFEVSHWPLQLCQDIRNNCFTNFNTSIKVQRGKILSPPSVLQLLNFFFIQLKLFTKRAKKLLFYIDYWNIGIAYSPIHEFLNSRKNPEVQWFPDLTKNRFMADPFGIYFKGDLHIVYEDLSFQQGIGKTARFLFKEHSFRENKIVIDDKFHMSYPFLLEYAGEIYCIPETYQANQVRLYKAIDFPDKWKLEKVLIENYAGIDSTIFKHKDIWYLFSTNKDSGPHHNLNIHFTDNIFGTWQEHPKNPVKTDIRSARPAGTMFEHNGAIFRPSMDYSEKIEGRIVINKIVTLTVSDFKEEMHNHVEPFENTYYCDKVHTLSQVGQYTLVDGAKELFIFSSINVLRYKISRILQRLMILLCGFIVF